MVALNYQEVELDHLVIFEKDSSIFAAGREYETKRIRIFLIKEDTGNVYARNGRADSWEELFGNFRGYVISNIMSARNKRSIPVYKIKGSLDA